MNYKLYDEWLIKNGREPDPVFLVYTEDLPEKMLGICEDINMLAETQFDDIFVDEDLAIERQEEFFKTRDRLYRLAEIFGVMSQLFDYVPCKKDDEYKLIITSPNNEEFLFEIPITELQYIILSEQEGK